jgi:Uma2 family endonuclease
MITKFSQLDLSKKYTYADYLTWQFKERVELIKGWVLKMSPAPSDRHQKILYNLVSEFSSYFKKSACQVRFAPFDVRLVGNAKNIADKKITTVVQPDLCVICDEKKLDKRGCVGAPDWIIEIVSPGNKKAELDFKFNLYQQNKVREYWIVSQQDETVIVFDLINDGYQFRKIYSDDAIIPVGIFKNFKIKIENIFY